MALKVGDRFASYKDFETAFQSYKKQKCVEFTVVDSRNIERINATTALSPLPDCLKFSRIRFCCIHHSKNKIKKNQTKQVPPKRKRSTFALGCSAEVTVVVCRKSEQLVVRKIIDEHNHPCDRASFDRYPAQRRLDHKKPRAVENKQKLRVSVKNMSQYIKTTSGRFHVTMNQPCRRMFTARFEKSVKQFTKEDSAEHCHHTTAVSASKPANAGEGGTSVAKRQCIPQSKCQKHKQAMAVFSAMADLMSSLGIQEFSAKLQLVTRLLNYWNKGIQPILYCPADPQTDCGIAGNQALPCQTEIKSRVRHDTAVLPVVQQNDAHGTLPRVIEQIVVVSPLSTEADGTSLLTVEVPDATSLLLAEAADAASQLVPVAEDATSKPPPAAKECKAYFCAHPKDSEASNAISSPNEPEQTKPVAAGISVTAEPGKTSCAAVTETKSGSIPKVLLGKRIPSATPAGQSGSTLKKLKKEAIMKPHQRFLARPPEKACRTKPPEEAGTGLLTLPEDSLQAIEQGLLLADEHIHAASILLRSRFPQCQGLADPVLGSKLMFGVAKGKFVQIIHDVSRQHWLTVSNIQVEDADVADVEVFDSLFSTLTMETKKQIAAILHSQKPDIKVRVVRNQAQQGSRDCGLFAIAVATSLLFGEKPEDVQYKQNEMRPHLLMCLSLGIINPFPCTVNQTKRIRTKICVISIYCLCRLPDSQEQRMIQCSSCQEWYHQTCLHLTAKEVEVLSRSSEDFFCGGGVKCLKG